MKLIFTFSLSLVMLGCLSAQTPKQKYTITSKKAIEYFESAQSAMMIDSLNEALSLANKAIDKEPLFAEAYLLRSYVYADRKEYKTAIENIEKAISINADFFPAMYLDLGGLYFEIHEFDKSKEILTKYLQKYKPGEKLKPKAERIIANCDFSKWAMARPVDINPVNAGPEINSINKDYNPVITVDGELFMVTRTIPDKSARMGAQEDFYVSNWDGQAWATAQNMGSPINSHLNEGAPTFSADGKIMIFVIIGDEGNYGAGRTGMGSGDLFFCQKINGKWTAPKNLGAVVNSRNNDTQPSLSADGKTLYFSSNRPGGFGTSDLYVTKYTATGWTIPENLGPKINTTEIEDGVFIHPNNQVLYFSSAGLPGLGQRDIYMCKRQFDGTWGAPINLGYPINTSESERSLFIDAKGDFAYFSSDRPGGVGDLDIYKFKMPSALKPEPVTYMKGVVYDAVTKQPLYAQFELLDLQTGKQVYSSTSDAKDGSFLVCLPTGRNYALNVQADNGYLFFTENFELSNPKNGEDAYRKDVPLNKMLKDATVVLKNVFFDTDSYDLKPESKVELDKLVQFLNDNVSLKIELGGHTDNQGDKKHNQVLSLRRATAVRDYLVAQGISADRLTVSGYADLKPIDSNDTEKGRANNRRMEFKVL